MKKIFIFFSVIIILIVAVVGIALLLKNKQHQDKLTEESNKPELELEIIKPERDSLNSYSEFSVISKSKLTLQTTNYTDLRQIEERDGSYYYLLKISNLILGVNQRKVTVVGEGTKAKELEIKINKVGAGLPSGFESIDAVEGTSYIIDPSNPLVVVDKKNRLPEDFEPKDIVNLNKDYGLYTFNDAALNRDAAINLKQMWNDLAKATGEFVTIASGYRSWADQYKLYVTNLGVYGEEETDKMSARPGYSEHQLGVTIDIATKEVGYKLIDSFSNTKVAKWLYENSYKYGFAAAYPTGTTGDENIEFYEPWQFRFIGIDNAKEHKESGKSLNAWLRGR